MLRFFAPTAPDGRGRAAWLKIGVLAFALAGIAVWHLAESRARLLDAQRRDAEIFTVTIAQHASRSIAAVSATLAKLADRIEADGVNAPTLERVRRSAAEALPLLPQIGEVVIADENGRRVFDSGAGSLLGEASIRAVESAYGTEPRIGPNVRIVAPDSDDRRSDIAAIVSRRIDRPDGSFGGVAIATLSSAYFKRFYDGIDLGTSGTIILTSTDGMLLMRRPALAEDVSRDLRNTVLMRAAAVATQNTLPIVSVLDGVPRLLSYQKLPDYPLIVAAALTTSDYLVAWWKQIAIEIGMLLIVLAIIGLLFLRNDSLEFARRKNARHYKLFAENCGDLVLIKGEATHYEYASPACRAMLGYEPEEVTRLSVEDLVHPEDLGPLQALQARLSLDEPVGRMVLRDRHKDGRFVWVEAVTRLVTEGPSGGRRLVITARDISARVQAEREAAEAWARASLALEATSDFVFAVDRDWRVTYMNRQLLESRYAFCELGQMLWEMVPHLLGTSSETAYRRAMTERISVEATSSYGHDRWFTSQCAPINGPDGGIFVFFREVTAAKRVEDTLRADRDHAEALGRAKSEFMANMSHELRTPLNAVIGFAQMLELETPDPRRADRRREYATDIRQSGEHLLELINEILDYSKAESGHLPLYREDFDPAVLIENCVRMMGPRAERNGVSIDVEAERARPNFFADQKRVRQIVLNLLSNAVKFTLTGGRIAVVCRRDRGLVIAVTDTGIGIADSDIGHVMEAFTQVNERHNRHQEGTGLGLPLSRRLAEMHGGTLEIDSRLGIGTTVTLWIPESAPAVPDPDCHKPVESALQQAAA